MFGLWAIQTEVKLCCSLILLVEILLPCTFSTHIANAAACPFAFIAQKLDLAFALFTTGLKVILSKNQVP
jgi:hypothetical protein